MQTASVKAERTEMCPVVFMGVWMKVVMRSDVITRGNPASILLGLMVSDYSLRIWFVEIVYTGNTASDVSEDDKREEQGFFETPNIYIGMNYFIFQKILGLLYLVTVGRG